MSSVGRPLSSLRRMRASDEREHFVRKPDVPDNVSHLDPDVVVEV
jgi:hypothetical protein